MWDRGLQVVHASVAAELFLEAHLQSDHTFPNRKQLDVDALSEPGRLLSGL